MNHNSLPPGKYMGDDLFEKIREEATSQRKLNDQHRRWLEHQFLSPLLAQELPEDFTFLDFLALHRRGIEEPLQGQARFLWQYYQHDVESQPDISDTLNRFSLRRVLDVRCFLHGGEIDVANLERLAASGDESSQFEIQRYRMFHAACIHECLRISSSQPLSPELVGTPMEAMIQQMMSFDICYFWYKQNQILLQQFDKAMDKASSQSQTQKRRQGVPSVQVHIDAFYEYIACIAREIPAFNLSLCADWMSLESVFLLAAGQVQSQTSLQPRPENTRLLNTLRQEHGDEHKGWSIELPGAIAEQDVSNFTIEQLRRLPSSTQKHIVADHQGNKTAHHHTATTTDIGVNSGESEIKEIDLFDNVSDHDNDPAAQFEELEELRQIEKRKQLIVESAKLSAAQREVYELRQQGLNETQMAARLNKPLGTVRALDQQGKKKLRKAYATYQAGQEAAA